MAGTCRLQEADATLFHGAVALAGAAFAFVNPLIGITVAMQSTAAAVGATNEVGSALGRYNTTCNEIQNTKKLTDELAKLQVQIQTDKMINADTSKKLSNIIDDYNDRIQALKDQRRKFRIQAYTNIAIDVFIVFALITIIINKKSFS
jgi:flavin-dependent dehydrogenase